MHKMTRNLVAAILISLFCTIGCGPSEEEVIESMDMINKGFQTLPIYNDIVGLELKTYGKAEFSLENDSESIHQNAIYSLEEDNIILEGVCTFSGYSDNISGVTMNGKITYDFKGKFESAEDPFFQFIYDLTFDSGKVETFQWSINSDNADEDTLPEILINGKKVSYSNTSQLQTAFQKSLQLMNL